MEGGHKNTSESFGVVYVNLNLVMYGRLMLGFRLLFAV